MIVYVALAVAGIPFIYYLIAIFSSVEFFLQARRRSPNRDFTPAVSILKPIRGLDPDAYENFASFCEQDYPQYEIVFCVDLDDASVPIIEKLRRNYPQRQIRILFGSGREVANDKVGRLIRLTQEAQYDLFVIADGDVRVEPNYLRSVVEPFADQRVGAVTCLYASVADNSLLETIQSVSMMSDFFPGCFVAWKLDGIKFALAQTIVTRRKNLEAFGGYEILTDRPADDLYIGRLVAEQGFETILLPYVVKVVPDFGSLGEFFQKRLRWMTVMRHMRPSGHFGLLCTWGLPWCLFAIAIRPTLAVSVGYLGTYLVLRLALTWLVGVWGMHQTGLWKKVLLIPVWDLMAFAVWLISFGQTSIRWRGVDYSLRDGELVLRPGRTVESAPR